MPWIVKFSICHSPTSMATLSPYHLLQEYGNLLSQLLLSSLIFPRQPEWWFYNDWLAPARSDPSLVCWSVFLIVLKIFLAYPSHHPTLVYPTSTLCLSYCNSRLADLPANQAHSLPSIRHFKLLVFPRIFLFYFIYLFLAALGVRCCAQAFSSCSDWGYSSLRCAGFSLRWLLLLRNTGSRQAGFSSCGWRALERRLNSCRART